ncbi:MAG: FHA domain-containing protein [Actinomycetota bacterium]
MCGAQIPAPAPAEVLVRGLDLFDRPRSPAPARLSAQAPPPPPAAPPQAPTVPAQNLPGPPPSPFPPPPAAYPPPPSGYPAPPAAHPAPPAAHPAPPAASPAPASAPPSVPHGTTQPTFSVPPSLLTPAAAPAAAEPAAAEPCPRCGEARLGRFCAACGFSFEPGRSRARHAAAPPSGVPYVWTAVVAADRSYYESMIGPDGPAEGSPPFPGYLPNREYQLTAPRMRIGRRSAVLGLEPDIDLTGPPADPGVSRLHAILVSEPDGSWALLDSGSANGTLVNDREIVTGVRVPLHDGDRIHMGAWTLLTIQAR